ncbi:hypothetical protein M0802_006566 [Mischocyttarus mexicanus]|nr:hypothetical protein M0802_006566 [Mischocyttarus mexicanus]
MSTSGSWETLLGALCLSQRPENVGGYINGVSYSGIMHYGAPLCQDTGSVHGALPENGVGTIHTRTRLNYTPLWL